MKWWWSNLVRSLFGYWPGSTEFLSHTKLRSYDDRFPLSLWDTYFCSSLGVPLPTGPPQYIFKYQSQWSMTTTPWVILSVFKESRVFKGSLKSERGGQRTREGVKSRMGRLKWMKHGSGIKDRDDRSSGIEILMTDVFSKINPTVPWRLSKQAEWRNRKWSDSSGCSSVRTDVSEELLFATE
jgi:hypothetical protein